VKTINQLEEQISNLLAEESDSKDFDKLEWLCDHLREYLERWLGFARAEQIAVEASLQNDLFLCVLAAINLISKELEISPEVKRDSNTQWSEFKNAVEWIKRTPNREDLGLIENTFVSFGKAALSKQFRIDAGQAVPIKDLNIRGVS
jgi:hypothetical protein